ncbi:MAG: hypothetical protein RLZ22_1501 [Verrucomicrobiota bacterium]|jgi:tetratricopeptide (TPR) repeat protein
MNSPIAITLLCVLCLSAPARAADKVSVSKQIDRLIASLSDENFNTREDAARELWKLGDPALTALEAASRDTDPEKSMRARDIARRIQLGITPETDPMVIALTDRYALANPDEKSSILKKLKAQRTWLPMLKLFSMESSAEVLEEVEGSMTEAALMAAREAIAEGDVKLATEYLEWSPKNRSGYLARADFLRSQGLLDRELKKFDADKNVVKERSSMSEADKLVMDVTESLSHPRKIALLMAKGDTQAAADLAKKMGHLKTAALMLGISGDPLPWLELIKNSTDGSRLSAEYATAAHRWWKGNLGDTDLEVFLKALDSKQSTERDNALNAMHALGRTDLTESTMIKAHPLIAFQYFDMIERPSDALSALGLNDDGSNAHEWVAGLLAELESRNIEDQREPSTAMERLTALAYFNERRGLHNRNDALFLDNSAILSEKNPELFIRLMGNLFGSGEVLSQAPRLAWRMASKWAGQDPQRWELLVTAVLGEEDVVSEWWEWLGELDPDSSPAVRCDAMMVIFKMRNDSDAVRDKIIQRVWQSIDAVREEGRTRLLARMLTMALASNDLANMLRALDLLPQKTRDAVPWETRMVWLSAANRWDEVASMILSQIENPIEIGREPNAEIHAFAASALRRAGRIDESKKHERLADQLALGDPATCLRVANGYAFGEDYRTASEWWKRALIYADAESDQDDIYIYLKSYADDLLEQSDWSKAAAAFEMLNAVLVKSEPRWQSPVQFTRTRMNADMCRALSMVGPDRKGAIALLGRCHRNAIGDGTLADYFFPALRKAGLKSEHDEWFRTSWNYLRGMIEKFPNDDLLRNNAAWFASRAARELETAEKDITSALSHNPNVAAYLDTMAEIEFAKGNRAKAVKWSIRALEHAPLDDQIRRQSSRFRSGPFPVK